MSGQLDEPITIDCREPGKIREIFSQIVYKDDSGKEHTVLLDKGGIQLPTGDILYKDVIIERKEAQDFVSSICDGRLFEQAELMKNYQQRYIIIVGDFGDRWSKIKPNSYLGALASLAARHRITILQVDSDEQFAYLVVKIFQKATDGRDSSKQVIVKRLTEKPNLTSVVNALPLLGKERAEVLVKKFPTAISLCRATEKELQEVDGIGSVIAKNIKVVFFEEPQ